MEFHKLEKTINVAFNDKKLLKKALTHRSYLNEVAEKIASNERLEFLGDAVLELIVSSYLYNHYPHLSEGQLTSYRSAIVNTKSLASVARKIGLGGYLYLSKGEERGGGRENESLLADTFEAVLGAIYLDQGLKTAQQVVKKLVLSLLPKVIKSRAYLDYKSSLQALVQNKARITPNYKTVRETGPDHAKTFYVVCLADGKILGRGKGKNKQAAEQNAAKNALGKLTGLRNPTADDTITSWP